jgi:hypothetical protein
VGILGHSFLDFNLQIPANAAPFYVLCSIAGSAPLQESQKRSVLQRHRTRRTLRDGLRSQILMLAAAAKGCAATMTFP